MDAKAKQKPNSVGLIVYLGSEDEAKAKIRDEETENLLTIRGSEDDPERFALVRQIFQTITHETSIEKKQREIEMINDINQCQGSMNVHMITYVNKREAKLARYMHQKMRKLNQTINSGPSYCCRSLNSPKARLMK